MIPLPSLTGGRSREHSRLAKASVENIIIIKRDSTFIREMRVPRLVNVVCERPIIFCAKYYSDALPTKLGLYVLSLSIPLFRFLDKIGNALSSIHLQTFEDESWNIFYHLD